MSITFVTDSCPKTDLYSQLGIESALPNCNAYCESEKGLGIHDQVYVFCQGLAATLALGLTYDAFDPRSVYKGGVCQIDSSGERYCNTIFSPGKENVLGGLKDAVAKFAAAEKKVETNSKLIDMLAEFFRR